jgi:hypothetical protein
MNNDGKRLFWLTNKTLKTADAFRTWRRKGRCGVGYSNRDQHRRKHKTCEKVVRKPRQLIATDRVDPGQPAHQTRSPAEIVATILALSTAQRKDHTYLGLSTGGCRATRAAKSITFSS